MKTSSLAVCAAALLLSTLNPQLSTAYAQLVADGATNTLSNVTTNITGDVTVGTNGSFTLLVLSDNALLNNSANGLIGRNATARSNAVQLPSPSARWLMGGTLFVGSNGAFNLVVISNGALLSSTAGVIGQELASSNNVALVTGAGSSWKNQFNLDVGNGGAGNRMEINNGGMVENSNGRLGISGSGTNNEALVTGTGSLWSNRGGLFVGILGAGNRLVISNSGRVATTTASYIGGNIFSGTNEVVVTGAGSFWSIGNNLDVGLSGGRNRLLISDGGRVANLAGRVGGTTSFSSSNMVVVTGVGSSWSNQNNLDVGEGGAGNRLEISDGAVVANLDGRLGLQASSSSNVVLVAGAGSLWSNRGGVFVGVASSGNRLVISNGGQVLTTSFSYVGGSKTISNNEAIVSGAGSLWSNRAELYLGNDGSGNRLVVSSGGTVSVSNLFVGFYDASLNNRVAVDGGMLLATNPAGTGMLDVRGGTNVLNAGLIDVGRLLVTNVLGAFEFNGGTLNTRGTTINNGRAFIVGNGASAATLQLQGGTHFFAANLVIAGSASLFGNGTVIGTLTLQAGGTFAPGGSAVGTIVLTNSPVLQGATIMEIFKNGLVLTNDQIQVAGTIPYGGSLGVNKVGPAALTLGDRFKLFSAATYAGSFSLLLLPSLDAGLTWTNKLLVDGSIEVVGVPVLKFGSINLSGTNLIISGIGGPSNASYAVLFSTNVALPLSNWTSITTNQFNSAGAFSFTNGITPGTPQRFFRIRTP